MCNSCVKGARSVLITLVVLCAIGCGGGGGTSPTFEVNDDAYATVGNVVLVVSAANGVLQNDEGAGTVTSASSTTALGGVVSVQSNGEFRYDPPVGREGTDTFTYTMSNGSDTDTATVSIDVENLVWFIDDLAAPGGDGRFTSPFNSLAAFHLVQGGGGLTDPEEGDTIYIYEGSGEAYDGGIRLLDDQTLIGEGVELRMGNLLVLPAGGPARITNTEPDGENWGIGILLADRNQIEGLIVESTVGIGMGGEGISGPTTVDHVTIEDVGGHGVFLYGPCTGTFTFGEHTAIIDAWRTAVVIQGSHDLETLRHAHATTSPQPIGPFNGTFEYHGTISQSPGVGVEVDYTTPSSSITFSGGTIDLLAGLNMGGEAIGGSMMLFWDVGGTVFISSPTTIEGLRYGGLQVLSCSGALTFVDLTVNVSTIGSGGVAVQVSDNPGASVTFTNLEVSVTGIAHVPGEPASLQSIPLTVYTESGPTYLTINGNSSLRTTDAGGALSLWGGVGATLDLDVTFADITCLRPQLKYGTGLELGRCSGSFAVTGTTQVVEPYRHDPFDTPVGAAIDIRESSATFTFADVDLRGDEDFDEWLGVRVRDSTGVVSVLGGTIDFVEIAAVQVESGIVVVSDVTISDVSRGVTLNLDTPGSGSSTLTLDNCNLGDLGGIAVELHGTVTLSGTGNTAPSVGLPCLNSATSVTGSIGFGAAGTCP